MASPQQYCDRGTLRDAVCSGTFHGTAGRGTPAADVDSVVEVLLDVAGAVQYLHSMKLVHGDIKVRPWV
jgi:serine/threonine protein kinase